MWCWGVPKRECVLTKNQQADRHPSAVQRLARQRHKHLHAYGSTDRTGWDEQTVAGAVRWAAVVSYGRTGDCGPGPVLSSTRGMGQLKEPSPCHTTNRALLAELWGHMAARWKTCWQLGDRKMPWKQREQPRDPEPGRGLDKSCYELGIALARKSKK